MGSKKMARKGRRGQRRDPQETARVVPLPSQVRDVHKFVRSSVVGNLAPTAADKGWAWTFALSDMPNSTEFTSLFDQYRIRKAILRFTYTNQSTTSYPVMYVTSDYDSAVAPATSAELTQRRHVTWAFGPTRQQFEMSLEPRALMDVGTGGASGYSGLVPRSEWIDLAFSTLTHRGVVAWIANFNTTSGGGLIYEEELHFECAGLR